MRRQPPDDDQGVLFQGAPDPGRDPHGEGYNESQRKYMNEQRAKARDIEIPEVANAVRRNACRLDLKLFCLTYFPAIFYLAFARMHLEILAKLQDAILNGGRMALAAPRGYGKTMLCMVAMVWAILFGHCKFIVFVCATGSMARRRLKLFKRFFERKSATLVEDFPEACAPVISLKGAAQKAKMQTYDGKSTELDWGTDWVKFAKIEDADCSAGMVSVHGLDGAIRGLQDEGRPDFIMVDDPQTRESADSVMMTKAREDVITQDIEGLVGPGESLKIVGLWTVIRKGDLADKFTSDEKPSYRSMKYKAMDPMPDNEDLMLEYIDRVKRSQIAGDTKARAAHAWYLANQERLEAGAIASWADNYDPSDVGDLSMSEALEAAEGSREREDLQEVFAPMFQMIEDERLRQTEISGIQSQFNKIAKMGKQAWLCEYQNSPPAADEAKVLVLDPDQVAHKTTAYPHRVVPEHAKILTAYVDVHRRHLDWGIAAISPGRRATVIDYDTAIVHSPEGAVDKRTPQGMVLAMAVEQAVLMGLRNLRDQWAEHPYYMQDGTAMPIEVCGVDARYLTNVIHLFCDESGDAYKAVMGMGSQKGLPNYKVPTNCAGTSPDGHVYSRVDHDVLSGKPTRRFFSNTDAFKRQVHEGFTLPVDRELSLALFKPETLGRHSTYASHICAEIEVELPSGETSWQYSAKGRPANHFLDVTYGCLVAASIAEATHRDIELTLRQVRSQKQTTAPASATVAASAAPPRRRRRRSRTISIE